MEDESLAAARKIYFDYLGFGFHMMREGVLNEYLGYGVSKEQEAVWQKELFEESFGKLDIHDEYTIFKCCYIIEGYCAFGYIDRLLDFLAVRIEDVGNQYDMVVCAQRVLSLVEELSRRKRDKKNFPRNMRVRCLDVVELFTARARNMSLDDDFQIPNFSAVSDGLTQQQYVNRKIVELEVEINLARILE